MENHRAMNSLVVLLLIFTLVLGCIRDSSAQTLGPAIAVDPQLVGDIVNAAVPLRTVNASLGELQLVTLRYCDNISPGQLLGLVVPIGGSAGPTSFETDDCTHNLGELRDRHLRESQSPEWAAAVRFQAEWHPWNLVLKPIEVAAGQYKDGTIIDAPDVVTVLLAASPLFALRTSSVRLSGRYNLDPLNLEVRFGSGLIIQGHEEQASPLAGDLRLLDTLKSGPVHATLLLRIPYTFLGNWVSREVGRRINTESGDLILLSAQVEGGRDRLRFSGQVRHEPSGAIADISYEWTGPNLNLTTVAINSIPNDCGQLDITRRVACRAANNTAAQLASGIQNRLYTRIGGRRFRPLRGGNPTEFNLEVKKLRLDAETLLAQANSDALYIYALAWLVP